MYFRACHSRFNQISNPNRYQTHIKLNPPISDLRRPFTYTDQLDQTSCCSGPTTLITVNFSIPRRLYTTDDSVPLTLELVNRTNEALEPITVKLNQVCTIRVQGVIR